jgi:thiol-disulfide isomerase/thioredoxin
LSKYIEVRGEIGMSSRAQRRAAQQVERRRQQRRWLLRGFGILALLLIGGLTFLALTKEYPGRAVPTLGNQHIASAETPQVPYNTRPPTSGPHLPSLARWGIYTHPIPDELQVHNLEDGGVLVQYYCPDCQEFIAKLEAIVSRYPDKVILAPYPEMDTPIALTAWGRIDTFHEVDEQRIVRFIEAYRGIDHHARRQ